MSSLPFCVSCFLTCAMAAASGPTFTHVPAPGEAVQTEPYPGSPHTRFCYRLRLPTSCVTLGKSLYLSGLQSLLLAEREDWATSVICIPGVDTCWAVTGRGSWVTCNSLLFFLFNLRIIFPNYS